MYHFYNKKRKSPLIILNLHVWDFFSKGLNNEFEIAEVNEPSVFEPLKFYCNVYFNVLSLAAIWGQSYQGTSLTRVLNLNEYQTMRIYWLIKVLFVYKCNMIQIPLFAS